MSVKIPGKAVAVKAPSEDDISGPVAELLHDLNLLPSKEELSKASGFTAAFSGPPDSVAVIEAGATSASKWWAGLIAAGAAGWATQATVLWDRLGKNAWNQPVTILSIALVLSAAAIGISYLLGSDVRGRAAAMVATVEARRDVAVTMIRAAETAFQPENPSIPPPVPIALPGVVDVTNGKMLGEAELGWKAIAARELDGHTEFLLVKGTQTGWVTAQYVNFT